MREETEVEAEGPVQHSMQLEQALSNLSSNLGIEYSELDLEYAVSTSFYAGIHYALSLVEEKRKEVFEEADKELASYVDHEGHGPVTIYTEVDEMDEVEEEEEDD